jgi:hypothetical protein
MQIKQIDSTEASSKQFAFLDASRRNSEMQYLYTTEQRNTAITAADLLDSAYNGKLYINYRKQFIAIKLETPTVKDPVMLKKIEELFEERQYTKLISSQGIIYRIPRK